jgi:hypothetical protein
LIPLFIALSPGANRKPADNNGLEATTNAFGYYWLCPVCPLSFAQKLQNAAATPAQI